MRRWSLDDVLALLWFVGGLVVAGYLLHLAVGPGSLEGSRWPLVGLAVVALIGFTTVAVRHLWAARRARAERESGPVHGWFPDAGSVRYRDPGPPVPIAPEPSGMPFTPGPPPELSPEGRAELARVVGILDRAGLFRPRTPRPVDLMEAVADAGEPVTSCTALSALWEGGYYHEDFDTDDHLAALAFHDSHTEQVEDTLREHVADLARLTGADIVVEDLQVGDTRTTVRLTVDGTTLDLAWASAWKYLSTVLHVAVARALPEVGLGWVWSDQGAWLGVPRGGVAALDAELGRAGGWTLVADEEPVAAGEVVLPRD
ncbi:hypothetical protein [Actinomycetospora termitidis]|uniref:Uncharacterized protein n=1 Tax=Actinomycetospora termitidis TaxID=3053470 RepID=A0ABT7M5E2_9PSEU|nr:hypothetical protein [Actinomycetospora sp. Odt1-22]MDL5155886.1 hypothetical protein [Actinomycetospora sp. Odt1-22]